MKEIRQPPNLGEFVQTQATYSAPSIFFFLRARPLRMAARTLPVRKAASHYIHVGEPQANGDCPQKHDDFSILMPKFQTDGSTASQGNFKYRTYPPDRSATVHSIVELIEFFPILFKTRMGNRRRYPRGEFERRHIGAETLPEFWRHSVIRQNSDRFSRMAGTRDLQRARMHVAKGDIK